MALKVLVTPSFERVVKKMLEKDKRTVDKVVTAIAENPAIGKENKGDLLGAFVHKFKLNKQETLLAYSLQHTKIKPKTVVLLAVGPHENFYTTLKR